MIDNSDSEANMTSKLKKVEQYLESKFIFCTKTWLKEKTEIHKNASKIEEKVYQEAIASDIQTFIDKDKVKSYFNIASHFSHEIKEKNIIKSIFFQVKSYSNIAEPKENLNKEGNNLDVLENFDSKYLQSEGEESKRTEKVVLKFELTDGNETVFGFEYEDLKELKKRINAEDIKFPKILIGPNFEVRRGIIFMKNNNTLLL